MKQNGLRKRYWRGNPKEETLEDLGVYGRIILKFALRKDDRRVWTGFIWLRIGQG
jgi:hypothetical protein